MVCGLVPPNYLITVREKIGETEITPEAIRGLGPRLSTLFISHMDLYFVINMSAVASATKYTLINFMK